eukprot:TRINITY_DN14358_c0_g1_i1.p1 TRINITY_DN14358_c0_g1~~TRINITY_DN14358_c0_g1_i1.p1  ORF type:complete len:232 (-),score=10.72 TRINITY_DN14358_c0_g1_i1:172-867(-)
MDKIQVPKNLPPLESEQQTPRPTTPSSSLNSARISFCLVNHVREVQKSIPLLMLPFKSGDYLLKKVIKAIAVAIDEPFETHSIWCSRSINGPFVKVSPDAFVPLNPNDDFFVKIVTADMIFGHKIAELTQELISQGQQLRATQAELKSTQELITNFFRLFRDRSKTDNQTICVGCMTEQQLIPPKCRCKEPALCQACTLKLGKCPVCWQEIVVLRRPRSGKSEGKAEGSAT